MTKRTTQTEAAMAEDDALAPMAAVEDAAETPGEPADDMAASGALADDDEILAEEPEAAVEALAGDGEAAQAADDDALDDENDFGRPSDDVLAPLDPDDADDGEAASDADAFALHDRPGPEETQALIDHLRAAPGDAPLVLDAASVVTTGTPYVLALAAAARSRAEAGAPAVLANPSAAVVDAFSDLGLFQDLMKMEFRP